MFFKKKIKKNKGFSLIELMVVVAIFAIISGVVLYDYGKFSSNLVVTNLAYEAALAVRQAQVYGISVKQTKASLGTNTKNFNSSYGVSFTKGSPDFYLFADADNNKRFETSEIEDHFSLNGSNKIDKFCIFKIDAFYCSDGANELDSITIIFTRPSPNAFIRGFQLSGSGIVSDPNNIFNSAEIIFSSGRGDKKARMTVTNTGQISVDSCFNKNIGACK